MLNKPQESHLSESYDLTLRKYSAQARSHQHGLRFKPSIFASVDAQSNGSHSRPILSLPNESLVHITSFLDAKSLLSLGLTNKVLKEHVDDENTWRAAFMLQFLGQRPDMPGCEKSSLLRRTEESWKKEFVMRQNLLRRWERSRNGNVTHVPHYSAISEVHLLADRSYGPALLSASVQYGIVARSLPLTGKALKGYLSTNDGLGFGIGNPNAEFEPNMTTSSITSEGWSVRVGWGNVNGEVMIASTPKIMDYGRSSSKLVRCRVADQHQGPVTYVCWDRDFIISAGSDGEVRIWEPKRMHCLCVLKDDERIPIDSCVRILPLLNYGIIVAIKHSGSIVIWDGIDLDAEIDIRMARPSMRIGPIARRMQNTPVPSYAFLDPLSSSDHISMGLHLEREMCFYRIDIDLKNKMHIYTRYSDGPLGPIQAITPFFETDVGNDSVIFVGDNQGRVCLFTWPSRLGESVQEIHSFRCLDIAPDVNGGVTHIAVNSFVFAVGTARGLTSIYDILTLCPLRNINGSPSRSEGNHSAVKEIILERDLIIIVCGDRVVAWKAGPVLSRKQLTPAKKRTGKVRDVKWHKRAELNQDISESRQAEADSHAHDQRTYARQRAHHAALNSLGLDEQEAVEYLLMLSRDEQAQVEQTEVDDGIFAGEMDGFTITEPRASLNPSPSPSIGPVFAPSRSNSKVQVSPIIRPEPMEAGGLDGGSSSPLRIGSAPTSTSTSNLPEMMHDSHFPAISSSLSSHTSGSRSSTSPPSLSGSWSSPLKMKISPRPSSFGSNAGRSESRPIGELGGVNPYGHSSMGSSSRSASSVHRGPSTHEEEDADLKLALELSLVEAMSLEDAQ